MLTVSKWLNFKIYTAGLNRGYIEGFFFPKDPSLWILHITLHIGMKEQLRKTNRTSEKTNVRY